MPFTDLLLKVLDEPGWFEVVYDCRWKDPRVFWSTAGPIMEKSDYVVPSGFQTDLASIPFGMRNLFSRTGKSRKPAVFHDHMYETKWRTRKECDKAFKIMLIDRGVSKFAASIYYFGVRAGGWTRGRW